jgi:hypothetical protein
MPHGCTGCGQRITDFQAIELGQAEITKNEDDNGFLQMAPTSMASLW